MASDHRLPPGPVTAPATSVADRERARAALFAELTAAPWDFGFLQTLRRLDCLQPGLPRIGATVRPADDPVRLGQRPSMRFAPAELATLQQSVAGRAPRLQVYFLGLLGPNGALPLHLTEYARERERDDGDTTFARFLDIFHHRMLSLLYRAWAQAQPAVSFDRPDQDRFGTYLASLSGNAMSAFQARDAMPDLAKRHYAGHLSCQTRHPEGLGSILRHLLALPVRIEEFVGRWLVLPPDCRLRLGETPETGALGMTTTLGARVWNHQSKFRVRIGPVRLTDYLSLLPGNATLARVKSTVRNYTGDALEWDLSPVLAAAEVPRLRLGAGQRLGWTTWLASGALGRDGDDLKLDPNRERPEARRGADQVGTVP
ncbi:type VI secretion system baseplate subunit TssG [uncultured Thiodictyon sp.]|uniref:type VI secretion system baseplate subunit TssG n=1 Tax=uncultured Thiodictyon sp. TaxID=1846217 RepID=UPI0025D14210|nr:type VI secretion system baseplate subunit TssG [uncultured Thiodictyon sp.]